MTNKCLVISTFFGGRRSYPTNYYEAIDYLDKYLSFITQLDSGTDSDIIVINHQVEDEKATALEKSLEYLSKWDNTKTPNGTLRTLSRPWGNGIGASHKSFDYIFNLFKNQYDYWYFQEDDMPITQKNYFSNCIKQLDADPDVAFICTNGDYFGGLTDKGSKDFFSKEEYAHVMGYITCRDGTLSARRASYDIHCHGGNGVTHTKYLQKVVEHNGHLPYHKEVNVSSKEFYSKFQNDGEIYFTNVLCQIGYKLKIYEGEVLQPDTSGSGKGIPE